MIRSLADEDVTVFVSSHLLGEVEQMCDHLVVIRRGRMVYQGSVSELQASRGASAHRSTRGPRSGGAPGRADPPRRPSGRVEGDSVVVQADPTWAGKLNRLAMTAGCTLVHLSAERPPLEEAFFGLTGTHSVDVVGVTAMGGVE